MRSWRSTTGWLIRTNARTISRTRDQAFTLQTPLGERRPLRLASIAAAAAAGVSWHAEHTCLRRLTATPATQRRQPVTQSSGHTRRGNNVPVIAPSNRSQREHRHTLATVAIPEGLYMYNWPSVVAVVHVQPLGFQPSATCAPSASLQGRPRLMQDRDQGSARASEGWLYTYNCSHRSPDKRQNLCTNHRNRLY